MSKQTYEKAKTDINLLQYISSTCAVKVTGGNGAWNINPNPFDMQSNDNFKVSYKKGVWLYNSFNSEEGGTIIDFIQNKEGLQGQEMMDRLNELLQDKDLLEMPVLVEEDRHNQGDINKLIKFIDTNEVEYFEKRGLSKEVIDKYKLGTCDSGIVEIYSELGMKSHPNMRNHKYMIPCYDKDNNLRFIVARNNQEPLQEGSKKTWNIKGIPTYFLNQFYIEGIHVNKGDIVVITESWGDALSVESIDNNVKVVALHSTANVKRLGELLTINRGKLSDVKFILAFNNDKPGDDGKSPGKVATNRLVKIMNQLNIKYKVFMPKTYNDLNEWLLSDKAEFEKEFKLVTKRLNCVDKINLSGNGIDAFFSWIEDNLRYIVNCDDESRFLYWNEKSWIRNTEEELRSLYGNFIKACESQVEENRAKGRYSTEEYYKILRNIKKWRNTSRAKECLSLISYEENLIIDTKKHIKEHHVYVSANGMIIDLKDGTICEAEKQNIMLHVSKYNLVDKKEVMEFMESKILKTYREHVLGEERLEFLLDFIAKKMSGKNYQLALINIGPSKCGKSMMKNIIANIFEGEVAHIPYAYLTMAHKGNMGAERDDVLVNLHNKKFGLASEADRDNAPISAGRFKNILSNSTTDARATGGKMQKEVNLTLLDLFVDSNEMPSVSGYDDAIENRLLFINWENPIPVEYRVDSFNRDIIMPNLDKIWSYFIYRAIDLKNKELVIPEIVKKDSANRKGELDKFTFNVVNKLEYKEGEFIELDTLIEELEIFKLCPELKDTESLHKDVTDRIKVIPGFEDVIQYRKGKLKVSGVKGLCFK